MMVRTRRRLSVPGVAQAPSSPRWSGIPSPFIMANSMFRFILRKTWSVINLANSPQPALIADIWRKRRRRNRLERRSTMEVKATTKYLPISPRKLALVCDKVRGMDAEEALVVLEFMPHKGAALVYKTVASALANARNNFNLDVSNMIVNQIWAGEGPRLKRYKAGARGRYKP